MSDKWVAKPCECGTLKNPPGPGCGQWYVAAPDLYHANMPREQAVKIAAMPELLEACEAVIETSKRADQDGRTFAYVDCETQALSKCAAAIAKAKLP